jgi:hypothetical protein
MMVAAIHERDAHGTLRERSRKVQAAEAATDDYHARLI